ncbi:MAG: NADH-quinone oxidoreductase subunit N, partial [Actinomycetota bacterium]|nr:NADH-quinone oxidoreductase subunit N [Actinomycetota bacterium]
MITTLIPMAETVSYPPFEYRSMAPVLIVAAAAVMSVLIEALAPRTTRRAIQLVLVPASLLAALVLTITMPASNEGVVAGGSLAIDGPTLFLWVTILVIGLLAMLVMAERRV